jgi:hypothetical protein
MKQKSSPPSSDSWPDYDGLFSRPIRPILPPDPPVEKPGFLYRTRNSLWWTVILVVISATGFAFMKSDFIVGIEAESGCGDWP